MSLTVFDKISIYSSAEETKNYLRSLDFEYYESEDGWFKKFSKEYRYDRGWIIGLSEEGVSYFTIENRFSYEEYAESVGFDLE